MEIDQRAFGYVFEAVESEAVAKRAVRLQLVNARSTALLMGANYLSAAWYT